MEKQIEIAGQVFGGSIAKILVRQKSGENIELGDPFKNTAPTLR